MTSILWGLKACIVGAAITATVETASAQQMRDITIGLPSTSFANASARLAKELGFFEKHGLNAKLVIMDSGNATVSALISKSTDFALSGISELLTAQARGQKIVAISNTYMGFSATLVLSKAVVDSLGVSPNASVAERLKALNGLVIASPSATSTYTVSFKGAAEAVGASIRFTYMSQGAMVAALETGAIQGYVGGAPFWAIPVAKGFGVAWISGPKAELPAEYMPTSVSSVQVMRDFAETDPKLMKTMTAVFADVAKAIDERPDQVKAAITRLYPEIDGPTLDLLFATESLAWKNKPFTVQDMIQNIKYVKSGGVPVSQIDSVNPASLLFP